MAELIPADEQDDTIKDHSQQGADGMIGPNEADNDQRNITKRKTIKKID